MIKQGFVCWKTVGRRLMLLLALGSSCAVAQAQKDDFGMDFSLGVEKKIKKGMKFSLEGNARTQENTRKIDRWDVGASFDMKLYNTTSFDVKGFIGWEYMWVNNLAECNPKYNVNTYNDPVKGLYTQLDYEGYNLKHQYWRNRHRTSAGFAATYTPNKRWEFSLKETFQYSHFCKASTTTDKYRFNESDILYVKSSERKDYQPKDRVVLRSKLTVQHDLKNCPLDPYASVDYGCGLNYNASKWKFTGGTDIKLDKQNKIDVFYRYQTENDDDEPNGHLIGVGYKYKF